uniref:Uncharacterized protein n=1 Tax=Arundo donax TaxID=35708 RepID=A0A0A9C9A5_ARUDO
MNPVLLGNLIRLLSFEVPSLSGSLIG